MTLNSIIATNVRRAAIGILIPFAYQDAGAVCPNTTETAAQQLWNVHNCSAEYRRWFRDSFNLQRNHWDEGWGWIQCNPTFAFPKMMNSGYLLTYGLTIGAAGPWHSNEDYYRWASGGVHGFRYEPEDKTGAFASAFAGFWQTDRVEMACPSFNNRTAGERAGTMLHEATHIMYWRWSHKSNLPSSNCASKCSDNWFPHLLREYPYGQLAGHKHSMVQIQIEFLCDLSEFAQPWVPATISTLAGAEAAIRMANRIRNPPAWACGSPRPLPRIPSGAEVLLSTGSSFAAPVSWTSAGYGDAPNGWYVGDFNGDGKDDIFRYRLRKSGAEVLLSTGSSFAAPVSWTGAGYGDAPNGWYVGGFNGDEKDDIFRYMPVQ